MRRPPRQPRERPHANAARRALLCGLAFATGCASSPSLPELPARPPPAPGELRVALVFGPGADLDLYVTDPLQETVYFANSPSRATGGRLDADRRCDAAAPRIETVVFAAAPAGRYRVGVDYGQGCNGGDAVEDFVVIVESDGGRRELRGEISRGRFLPRVLELDLPAR